MSAIEQRMLEMLRDAARRGDRAAQRALRQIEAAMAERDRKRRERERQRPQPTPPKNAIDRERSHREKQNGIERAREIERAIEKQNTA